MIKTPLCLLTLRNWNSFFCYLFILSVGWLHGSAAEMDRYFSASHLTKLKSEKVPDWMTRQIESNFIPFSDGITLQGIDRLYSYLIENFPSNTFYRFLRFRVINGVIYEHRPANRPPVHEDYDFFKLFLTYCKQSGDLPDVDFVLHYNDATPCEYGMPPLFWILPEEIESKTPAAPLFTYGKFEDGPKSIGLIHVPWCFSLMQHNGFIQNHALVSALYPWEKRIDRAVWRGAPSDLHVLDADLKNYTSDELFTLYRTRPRYVVSEMSLLFPEYIDAGFTGYGGYTVLIPWLSKVSKNWMQDLKEHMRYKYLINLDGWGWSNNFWWGLAWGALCFKTTDSMTDWFYSAFQPYEHYIPIKKDLSDLIEKIQWAQKHDEICKQIAQNAASLFRNEVTNDHGLLYFYLVLKKYQKLQKFKPIDLLEATLKDPDWIRFN